MPVGNQLLNSCCRSLRNSKCLNQPLYLWTRTTVASGGTITQNADGSLTIVATAGGIVQIQDLLHSIDPTKDFCLNFRLKEDVGAGIGMNVGLINGAKYFKLEDDNKPVFALDWYNGVGLATSNPVGAVNAEWNDYEICKKGNNVVFRKNKEPIKNFAVTDKFPTTGLFPTLRVGGGLSQVTVSISFYCVRQ